MPNQIGFSFQESPTQSLRAVNATVNGSARDLGIQFFPNWRVPLTSVVTKVFNEGGYDERDEDLDWWTASGGKCLGSFPVRIKARKKGNSVQALILPDPDYLF